MANTVGIRLNNIEEERVLGAMRAAGDENVSTHIKRVYFAALDRQDDYLHQISPDLELIRHELRELQIQRNDSLATSSTEAMTTHQELHLNLVSGVYYMLRQAAPTAIQRNVDSIISPHAVEEFLNIPHDDENPSNTTKPNTSHPDTTSSKPSSSPPTRPLTPYEKGKLLEKQESARHKELMAYAQGKDLTKGHVVTLDAEPTLDPAIISKIKKLFRR